MTKRHKTSTISIIFTLTPDMQKQKGHPLRGGLSDLTLARFLYPEGLERVLDVEEPATSEATVSVIVGGGIKALVQEWQ